MFTQLENTRDSSKKKITSIYKRLFSWLDTRQIHKTGAKEPQNRNGENIAFIPTITTSKHLGVNFTKIIQLLHRKKSIE